MVAVSLFSFVALLVGTIVFAANSINDRLAASRTVYEAINLVLDDMSREISQGTKYRCLSSNEFWVTAPTDINKSADCNSVQFGIAFRPSEYSSYALTYSDINFTNPVPSVGYTLEFGAIKRYIGVINVNGSNNVDYASYGRTAPEVAKVGKVEVISPPNVLITKFSITATNTGSYVDDSANIGQAFLQVVIEGRTTTNPIVPFSVQTTITQREPEN